MTPFAAKLRNGDRFLGLGLSNTDLMSLRAGKPVVVDLSSIGVGLWIKGEDGQREFLQPRNSKIVVIAGDSNAEIGEFLKVDLP